MSKIDIKRTGTIFVLSSPSGAGKTTVSKELVTRVSNLQKVVSVTTRPMRDAEIDGLDYIFVDDGKFDNLIQEGCFIETAQISGYRYGTLVETVQNNLRNNIDQMLTLNWLGAKNIHKFLPDSVVTIFIVPPSLEALGHRLTSRHAKDPKMAQLRLSGYREDMRHWYCYDYLVVNDDLNQCVNSIIDIIHAERMSCKRIRSLQNI